jgi:hypothetical protein
MTTILEKYYTLCSYHNGEVLDEQIRETGRCYLCPVPDVEDASEPETCPHGSVVSPAICRRYHED